MLRFGSKLGHSDTLTKPEDPRNPDDSKHVKTSRLERLYIRLFGVPDTVKHLQACAVFKVLDSLMFSSVLDVGCGKGQYSIEVAQRYPTCSVKAIDLLKRNIVVGEDVKQKFGLSNLTFEQKNILDFCSDTQFDLVLFLQVIEHLEDERPVLNKINSLLVPGGYLVVAGPASDLPKWYSWLQNDINISSHYREGYTFDEVVELLHSSGFHVETACYLSGVIGESVEKLQHLFEVYSPVALGLLFPILSKLVFFDGMLDGKLKGSGFFIVAKKL